MYLHYITVTYSRRSDRLCSSLFFARSHDIGCIKPCVFSILHLCKTKITDIYDVFDVKQKVSKPPLFTHVFGNWYLECFVKHTCTPAHDVKSVVFFHSISSSFHSWESKHIGFGRTAIFEFFRKNKLFWTKFSRFFRPMIIARKNRHFLRVVCPPTQNMAKCRDVPKTQRNFTANSLSQLSPHEFLNKNWEEHAVNYALCCEAIMPFAGEWRGSKVFW